MSCQRIIDSGEQRWESSHSPSMVLGAVAENIGNKSGRKGEVGGAPYSSSFGCGQPEALKERHLRGQTTPTWASPFCCCYSSQRSQRSRRGWWEWRDRGASAGGEVGVACHRLWCRKPMDCVRLTRNPPLGWSVCDPREAKRAARMPWRCNRHYNREKRLILPEKGQKYRASRGGKMCKRGTGRRGSISPLTDCFLQK